MTATTPSAIVCLMPSSRVPMLSRTVFFEAKAGPYRPLTAAECAPWAPKEGTPAAIDYLEALARLVDRD